MKKELYKNIGLKPYQLIDVKGLMGDSSDNIPGVPGIGEKTALQLICQYQSIENLYHCIEGNNVLQDIKGKTKEKIVENKELAFLSKELGTINRNVPLEEAVEDLKYQEWNKQDVFQLFKLLNFNRFIERFALGEGAVDQPKKTEIQTKKLKDEAEIKKLINTIQKEKQMIYCIRTLEDVNSMILQRIKGLTIYVKEEQTAYYVDFNFIQDLKEVLEDATIKKIGYKQKADYILLKENQINLAGMDYDIEVAAYLLNPTESKYTIEKLAMDYLKLDINPSKEKKDEQINLFDTEQELKNTEKEIEIDGMYAYAIDGIYSETLKKLKETEQVNLFYEIEMPLVEVLANMQYNGIFVNKEELIDFGKKLKEEIEKLTKDVYELAGEEFNINSTKQLGSILFDKLKLTVIKKTKSGYSTDVDVLEKLKKEHAIIGKILEYRQLAKLDSTYVEGLIPYIHKQDNKIHSYFHQTVTATGRISSSDPNLQNIPTRFDLGKQVRKVFKPQKRICIYRCRLFSN